MLIKIDAYDVRKGDVLVFRSHTMQVEEEPERRPHYVKVRGHTTQEGNPMLDQVFRKGTEVFVQRHKDGLTNPIMMI